MKPEEIAFIAEVARRAPFKNMNEAKAVDFLLQKLESHFAPAQQADAKAKPPAPKARAKKPHK